MFNSTPLAVIESAHDMSIHSTNPHHLLATNGERNVLEDIITSQAVPFGGRNSFLNFSNFHQLGNYGSQESNMDIFTPFFNTDIISNKQLGTVYRDIYLHDPISGAAVDLMSNLPFSDFEIIVPVEKGADMIAEEFYKPIRNLSLVKMLPEIARAHFVFGAFVSYLVYSEEQENFMESIPLCYSDCKVLSNPVYGMDPLVQVDIDPEIRQFFKNSSSITKDTINRVGDKTIEDFSEERLMLNPLKSIYFPRTPFPFTDKGFSLYERILPIYVLEKVLYRGTVTMANRRQSPVQKITAGDENWIPNKMELSQLVKMVLDCYKNPLGSVIATRANVAIDEVMPGGEFWKWNDVNDQLNNIKLMAFGINESFLSGDMTYNNLETALQVFLEMLKKFRDKFTHDIFYNKIFPLISYMRGFYKDRYGYKPGLIKASMQQDYHFGERIVAQSNEYMKPMNVMGTSDKFHPSDFIIGTVEWKKELGGENPEVVLARLDQLAGLGVPISKRFYAAAGDVDFDAILKSYDKSIDDEIEMAEYNNKLQQELAKKGLVQVGTDPQEQLQFSNKDSSLPSPKNFEDLRVVTSAMKPIGDIPRPDGVIHGKNLQPMQSVYERDLKHFYNYGNKEWAHNPESKHLEWNRKIVSALEKYQEPNNPKKHYIRKNLPVRPL